MEYFNKKAIVSIRLVDEREEPIVKLYKKGSWKKKPGLFDKGVKWEENVYEITTTLFPHRESTLKKDHHIVNRNGNLYKLSYIVLCMSDQSKEAIYFNSNKERDEYLKNFNLTDYIKLD